MEAVGSLGKTRDAEKIKDGLNKVVNIMQDLMKIAADHSLEEKLYNCGTINTIYRTIGDIRTTKFIEKTYEDLKEGEELWKELKVFLEREIKIQLEKSMIYRSFPKEDRRSNDRQTHHVNPDANSNDSPPQNNDIASREDAAHHT